MRDFKLPAKNPASPFADWRGHHVGVRVKDLNEAKNWYVEKLDFRVSPDDRRDGGLLDNNQAAGAAPFGIGRSLPVLDPAIDVQHVRIGPAIIAALRRKVVPVIFVPARPNHRVDA